MVRRVPLGLLVLATVAMGPARARGGDADKGKAIYDARCAFCHGPTGKGDGPAGVALKPAPGNFTTQEYWKAANLETLRRAIKNGKEGTAMVPFGATLSDADIDTVLATLQTFEKK